MELVAWLMAHYMEVVSAAVALLSGVIAVSLLIPGEAPEKQLQVVLDLLKKLSKK